MLANLITLLALKFRNFRTRFQYGKRHSFHSDGPSNLFFVRDGAQKHYFGVLRRGFSLYRYGLENRAGFIADSYCLSHINFQPDDIVVDCGANYGDLFLYLKNKIDAANYISIEPSATEHGCLKKNAPESLNLKKGLGDKIETKTFYLNERHADSSLIEPSSYSHKIEIEVITLDFLVDSYKLDKIKLLKLEAEGFEPEIIDGAKTSLPKIQYIALDGGYERGIEGGETFSEICNHLLQNNFELIETNWNTHRALFKNKL